jgi:hypothetical protein
MRRTVERTLQKWMTLTQLSGNMSQLNCRQIPAISGFFLDR